MSHAEFFVCRDCSSINRVYYLPFRNPVFLISLWIITLGFGGMRLIDLVFPDIQKEKYFFVIIFFIITTKLFQKSNIEINFVKHIDIIKEKSEVLKSITFKNYIKDLTKLLFIIGPYAIYLSMFNPLKGFDDFINISKIAFAFPVMLIMMGAPLYFLAKREARNVLREK